MVIVTELYTPSHIYIVAKSVIIDLINDHLINSGNPKATQAAMK